MSWPTRRRNERPNVWSIYTCCRTHHICVISRCVTLPIFGNSTHNPDKPEMIANEIFKSKTTSKTMWSKLFLFYFGFDRFAIVLRLFALWNTQLLCSFSLNQNHYFFIKSLVFNFVSFLIFFSPDLSTVSIQLLARHFIHKVDFRFS